MKVVNLQDGSITSVSSQYLSVPQPMFIYDNKDELNSNEDRPLVIKDQSDYISFIKSCDFKVTNQYEDVSHLNIWLKTQDSFIPETADRFGKITYETDEEGNKIPTDGCYIRLYKIYVRSSKHFLYTSSGLHTVSLVRYQLTGARKDQYVVDFRVPKTPANYEDKLRKELSRTKPSLKEVRLFHAMFNPTSEYFLNFDKAVSAIWGSAIRKIDRHKILTTKAFKETFMRELKLLLPGLTKDLQEQIPTKELAKSIKTILEKSIKEESSDKALDVIDYVIHNAYLADPNTPAGSLPQTSLPGSPARPLIDAYQDDDVNVLDQIKKDGSEKMKESVITDKDREEARDAMDYSEAMIMEEAENEKVTIPLIESDEELTKEPK